jgi:hypothetical protein
VLFGLAGWLLLSGLPFEEISGPICPKEILQTEIPKKILTVRFQIVLLCFRSLKKAVLFSAREEKDVSKNVCPVQPT